MNAPGGGNGESRFQRGGRLAELLALSCLVLVLPVFEFPKNLFWGLFVLAWTVTRLRGGALFRGWDLWDTTTWILISSGFLVALFSGITRWEWRGAWDLLRIGLVLWMVRRSGYTEKECRWLFLAMVISSLVGVGIALAGIHVSGTRENIWLPSVGHFNQSGIYLAVSCAAALSVFMAYLRRCRWANRVLLGLFVVFLLISVFQTTSRAAVGSIFLITLAMGVIWWKRSRAWVAAFSMAVLAAVSITAVVGPAVLVKHQKQIESDVVFSARARVWNVAKVSWQAFPVFGVGLRNFGAVDEERVRAFLDARGDPYVPGEYLHVSHAHSLYINALAEGGIVYFGAVLWFLLVWVGSLFRHRPRKEWGDCSWALYGCAFATCIITLVIGVVNTPLRYEHGLLSMIALGLWLGWIRNQSEESRSRS